jgi:hypothetical protein
MLHLDRTDAPAASAWRAARLFDHADSITNVVRHDMEVDCRLAARVCGNMATLRFRIMEIAEAALTRPGTTIRRDLLEGVADAEF